MASSLCRRGPGTWRMSCALANGTVAKPGSVDCARLERSV